VGTKNQSCMWANILQAEGRLEDHSLKDIRNRMGKYSGKAFYDAHPEKDSVVGHGDGFEV